MSRKWAARFFAVMTLTTLIGCNSPVTPQRPVLLPPPHRPDRADRTALPNVVRANNEFALNLYHRLRSEPGNLLISPACLTAGLGLLRAGARGETAAELDRVLHRPVTLPDRSLAALVQDLNADGKQGYFQVRLANALWAARNTVLLDDYRATLREVFAIDDDRQVDFQGHPDEAARTINAWVAERTAGKITGVVSPQSFTVTTALVLTSAIYFWGNWTNVFDFSATKDEPFHLTRTRSVTVPMMHQLTDTASNGYLDRASFQVLSMDCGRGAFAMDVLLPRKIDGLSDLEATLTPEMLAELWPELRWPQEIDISLPRFRTRSSRALVPVLQELGLSRVFDRKRADFSGINGKATGLYTSEVTHTAFVDVDEKGIEAAASLVSLDRFLDGGGPPPIVRADHPFLYLVRDTRSGCIVFLGRLVEPNRD